MIKYHHAALFWVLLAACSIERSVAPNPIQVKGRVKDRINDFVSDPVKILKIWNDYYRIGGFPNNMNAPDRDAVARYMYSIKLNSNGITPFYGLENGLFLGYFPIDYTNSSVPVLDYREPGQDGYNPKTSKMAIHYETCVTETGAEEKCSISKGGKFVTCLNNCEYIKCKDSASQADCSTLAGEDRNECESNVTWCRHYTVKEAPGTDAELGYIPTTSFCIDINGLNSQTEGAILLENEDGDIYLGDCTYESGALVDRDLAGPYADCGGDGEICNTTFVGGKASYPFDARTRPWYNVSKTSQHPKWSDAYVFDGAEIVGITATHPIKTTDEEGRTVFGGVLAADVQLDEISTFLENLFEDTKYSIAVYEAYNPNYMIATSTGNDFISKAARVDESQRCPDGSDTTDGYCLVRNTIDNLQGNNNDTVLRNAHRKLRLGHGLDENKNDVVTMEDDCEDNCTFVAVKGDDNRVNSTTYLSGYFLFNDSKTNLDWEVIVAWPLERDPEDAIRSGESLWVFVIVLSTLGFVICLSLFFVFIWHGNEQAIMLSDYKFTAAFVLMTSFLNLASLSFLGDVTDQNCMINMWVFNMLVCSAISPLFVKSYRTWLLLGSSPASYGKAKMSNFRAWIWTIPIPLVEAIILTIITLVDPPKAVETVSSNGGSPIQSLSCEHKNDTLGIIDTIYFTILIGAGCVLAFLTRRIDPRYADSKALIFVMFNIATVLVFILAFTTLVDASGEAYLSNEVVYTMTAIGLFWICVFSCAIFTLPRITKAKRDRMEAIRELSRQRQAEAREITKRSLEEVAKASHGIHKSEDSLKVLVCAANLGNAEPTLASMKTWIPDEGKCDKVTTLNGDPIDAERFDIIAIGMQESTWSATNKGIDDTETSTLDRQETDDLEDNEDRHESADETQNYIAALEGEDTFALRDMERKILGERYTLVKEEIRGQMRLYVWSLKGLAPFLDDVTVSGANTGIGNVLANKGGIVISFEYQKTRFTFLSAHLAAHEGESYYQTRCENMRDILRSARPFDFGGQKFDLTVSSHQLFVFGDLNFRTKFDEKGEHKENVQRALDLINKQDFETLYSHDELHKGILAGDLLLGAQTLPCNFNPTFKVHREPGFVYTEKRTPSYTDRIAYKSGVGLEGSMLPLSYEPCVDFVTSDHKPIRGAFSVVTNEMVDPLDLECRFRLTFSEMECFDLPAADMNGLSDPFLMFVWDSIDMEEEATRRFRFLPRFFSDDNWPRTDYISKTLNPKFKGKEIILSSIRHEVSREAVLLISAWDYDFGTRNTRLGTLALSILDLVSMEQNQCIKELYFDRLLEANGKYAGRIKFKVVVSMIIG